MKILIYGVAPWVKTAYGRNTSDLMDFLTPHFDVDVASYYGHFGHDMTVGPCKVYPIYGHFQDHPTWLQHWKKRTKADVILQHFDIWVMPQNWILSHDLPVVTYSPIDCVPMHPKTKDRSTGAITNVAMSEFGRKSMKYNGMRSKYIPHWVDHEIFKPMDKKECRRKAGMPEDKFIVGVTGTNKSPRKNIPRMMLAFKKFIEQTPGAKTNSMLYLHTKMERDANNPMGHNLLGVAHDLELSDNISWTKPEIYLEGFPTQDFASMYNCFDVLLHTSMGEGFGLCIIEAQACGVPTIVTGATAMPEVCGAGGICVPAHENSYQGNTDSWMFVPSTESTIEALQIIYENPSAWREPAIKSSMRYDIEKVMPQWVDLFRDVQEEFGWP